MFFLLSVCTVAAGTLEPPSGYGNLNSIDIGSLVSGTIKLLLLLTFIASFIFLMIGGFRWVLSGGDKAAVESAKGTLTAALIGLIITLLVWAIIWFVEQLFGISIIGTTISVPVLHY